MKTREKRRTSVAQRSGDIAARAVQDQQKILPSSTRKKKRRGAETQREKILSATKMPSIPSMPRRGGPPPERAPSVHDDDVEMGLPDKPGRRARHASLGSSDALSSPGISELSQHAHN
ncbi:hypothetical protein RRG08_034360 [Elysia crispata]|uniref:Uncharacterized protein n=1 Tax=Elysia crispata TaxID=231223 RepID=A0AAE1CWP0_9GAST|nr:hypothetical protein RRG08_034360 [Elysia crispata]